ncbi:MAG: hypothetical protein C0606_13345 [Hyphomicrobiales bacterium]|nr:MAG: hypothetical protein C0606_13345 [Hyphomicrobiales bacterium]
MNTAVASRPPGEVEISAHGKMYHFLSMCFAHPDGDMLEWWQGGTALEEILAVAGRLPKPEDLVEKLMSRVKELVEDANQLSFEELEATYIRMFACGVPQVLCPPYSSLFTSADDDKRLGEMIAVRDFYEDCGMVVSADFKDLPDHICVEFEFLQYLAYEAERARVGGEEKLGAFFEDKARGFIDRHAMGLLDGMEAVTAMIRPHNFYCGLIGFAAAVLRHDRACRHAATSGTASVQKGLDQ